MTIKEVAAMIQSIGVPFAYYQFPEGTEQACPFICFYFDSSNDFLADNRNYQKIRPLSIELYTDNKNFILEETVEGVLTDNGFVYTREESYIDSEHMYLVVFETSVAITEEEGE